MLNEKPSDDSLSQARAGARYGEIHSEDLVFVEATSSPWDLMITPIGNARFGHWKQYLVTPSVVLYREWYASPVRFRGLSPAGMLGLSLPLRLGDRSVYWDSRLRNNALPATLPGGVDAVYDRDQSALMVFIALDLLHEKLPPPQVERMKDAARSRFVTSPPDRTQALAAWLIGILAQTKRNPGLLDDAKSVHRFEDELLARLADVFESGVQAGRRPHTSQRRRGLERALGILRDAELSTLSVPALCKAANVSQRTLEYAFRETFDLTPLGFLRLRRFHDARRQLMLSNPAQATVAQIAHADGFFQLGRFAEIYSRLFGELPSETLRRAPPAIEPRSPLT